MKEGEEEEPVIHNEAAVFRWESNKLMTGVKLK